MLTCMLTQRYDEGKIEISVQIEITKMQNSLGKSNQSHGGGYAY